FPNWCVEARTGGQQRSRWSAVSAGALPGGLQGFPGAHDAFWKRGSAGQCTIRRGEMSWYEPAAGVISSSVFPSRELFGRSSALWCAGVTNGW
ncbi:hypothetical protein R3Q06_35635, partial [Rhodococcus erythropolis]|uniref:hypothetical protein n=1 Tax=Rhodococcus erythropolis TaxID=1833 RepID=UPI002948CD22